MQKKLYYTLLLLFSISQLSLAQVEVTTIVPEINASGGMTIDQEGNIYVSDFGPGNQIDSNTVIYKIDKNTFSASVFADGFIGASGSCFDSRGNFYQSNNNGNRISKIAADGTKELNWSTEGFNQPIGIITDNEDNLFVCNCSGNNISKILPDGTASTFAESELFNCPNGITVDPNNNLYVCNFSDGKILKITATGEVNELAELQTLVGGPSPVGNGHITYSNGYLLVNLIGIGQIQRVCLTGEVDVVAGRPFGFSNEDGSATSATFSKPNGVVTSITGDTLFVNTSTPSWVTRPSELHPNQIRMITGINSLPEDLCEDQPPASNILFSEIIEGVIFETLTFSVGSAWGDYNQDGFQDLFVTDGLNSFGSRLYQNNGDLTFTPVSNATTQDGASSFSAIWGDYDNDGNLDLYVSNNSTPPAAPQPNLLYKNDGAPNYTFTKITNDAPVLDSNYTWSSTWVDYDNDGDLDLHVPENRHRGIDFFFENNGTPDGAGRYFSKTTPNFITDVVESTGMVSWMDYDNDGDQDLFMIKSGRSHPTGNEDNRIFHNQLTETGTLNFQRITSAEMVNHLDRDFQASWGDYDNDGDMDVYLGNFDGSSYLYRNNGDSLFTRIMEGAIVENNTATLGSSWGDYDNDGDLDLFTTNNLGQNANYYENDGKGNFTSLNAAQVGAPLLNRSNTQSCSNADFNNDGYLDLFVANAPLSATQLSRDFLYLNEGGDRNYLLLTLKGTTSNAAAIGTKVRIKTTDEEESTWQMRVISGNPTGDRAQNSLRVHFGLDENTNIDSMIVEWTSGQRDVFTNVKASQICQITEGGMTTCQLLTNTKEQMDDLVYWKVSPNPVSGDSLFLEYQLENTKKLQFLLYDLNGKLLQSHKQNNEGQFQMNLQNLNAGIYILTLQTKKGTVSKKIVVK